MPRNQAITLRPNCIEDLEWSAQRCDEIADHDDMPGGFSIDMESIAEEIRDALNKADSYVPQYDDRVHITLATEYVAVWVESILVWQYIGEDAHVMAAHVRVGDLEEFYHGERRKNIVVSWPCHQGDDVNAARCFVDEEPTVIRYRPSELCVDKL